jgi:hypothetical protein
MNSMLTHLQRFNFHRGFAQGTLLKNESTSLLKTMFQHVDEKLDKYLKFLPDKLRQLVERLGINAALDLTYEATRYVILVVCYTKGFILPNIGKKK